MAATIAFIAHDARKDDLVNFVTQRAGLWSRYQIIATKGTAERLQTATQLTLTAVAAGAVGGDIQIAAQVVEGTVIAVIFLIDPLYSQPHEPSLLTLQQVCNLYNVPLATNLATAEAIAAQLAKSLVAHLIYNPVSGQGNAEQELALIQQLLEPNLHLHIHTTTPDISPEEMVKTAIADGADIIIASGGDGTVSTIAGALVRTGIPLGIIPRGTANAFAVALGIPRFQTIRAACQAILAGHTRTVDAAQCNGIPMVLLAGVGYEAETVERASREMKTQWGAMAYIMAGWQLLDEQTLFDTTLETEEGVLQFQAAAITIANAAPPTSVLAQGGGEVILDDGLLDVTVATAETKLQAVTTMLSMLGAALVKSGPQQQNVIHGRTKRITVKTEPPQKVVVDGEIIGTTPIEVECIPGGLTVLVPNPG